jgi:quercetin dioxygenase-like cupin family protein
MKVTVDAPSLGQRLTFLPSDDDTLRSETLLQPGAFVPMHIHLRQHERFELTAGELDVWAAGKRRRAGPGDSATIPPGVPHRFHNHSGLPVEVNVAIWPALHTRELFETLFALDRAGALNRMGAPGPLRLGLLTRDYGDELFLLARVPPRFQLGVGRALGAIAARAGTTLVPA